MVLDSMFLGWGCPEFREILILSHINAYGGSAAANAFAKNCMRTADIQGSFRYSRSCAKLSGSTLLGRMEFISNPSGLTPPCFLLNECLKGNLSPCRRYEQIIQRRGSFHVESSACLTILEHRHAGFLGDIRQDLESVIDCKSISLYSPSTISQFVAIRTSLFQIITVLPLEHGRQAPFEEERRR